jgi:uncharacterized protein YqfA (UPF0365 family)
MNGDPVVLAVAAVFCVFLLFLFVHLRLWVQALLTNTPVSIFDIIGMRFRRCPPTLIVHAMIELHQRGIKASVREVEQCYRAARENGTSVDTAGELAILVEAARQTESRQT